MPLSEHEQRLLEQMEKALYAEDPKFATSLRSPALARGSRSRAALGILGILVGMGVLLTGVAVPLPALGVAGFAIMLVSAVLAYAAFRAPAPEGAQAETGSADAKTSAPKAPKNRTGFMDRMEDRWRRRTDDGGL
ncbi:MAG: DUF3040 domain-containing protein [Limisphaerales bacterium]